MQVFAAWNSWAGSRMPVIDPWIAAARQRRGCTCESWIFCWSQRMPRLAAEGPELHAGA